jgi:hypothetical protein
MGLYELITNQYNPFAENRRPMPGPPAPSPSTPSAQPVPVAPPAQPSPATPASATPPAANPATAAPGAVATRPATPVQFAVEDSLTQQRATVTIAPEDASAAEARFKRVEELLAGLTPKHVETPSAAPIPPAGPARAASGAEPPAALTSELHTLLASFEQRLSTQFDKAVADAMHARFQLLEERLQHEVRDALRAEIEAVQRDDAEVQQALVELQSMLQAAESGNPAAAPAVEAELALLQRQLGSVRDEIRAIPPHLYFRLVDGRILKDLPGLRTALETMAPEVFAFHVGQGRNDFAAWVADALAMPTLGDLLRQATTPQEMRERIVAHDGLDD